MIPIHMIPGVKLGFANIPILVCLYLYSWKDAFYLTLMKVFLFSLLRTGLFNIGFYLSLTGSLAAIVSLFLVYKTPLSILGVSMVSSLSHSLTQIGVASILLNISFWYYLPFVMLGSLITGCITGMISKTLILKLKEAQ